MSTIPAKKIERNRDNPEGRNHAGAAPESDTYNGEVDYCFALGGGT